MVKGLFWHDIWIEKSLFIDKISQESRLQITEVAKVSYSIEKKLGIFRT